MKPGPALLVTSCPCILCVFSYIDEEITQSKLNCIQWKKSGEEKEVRLKIKMSLKWKEMGQNLDIDDAELLGYQGDNIQRMDSVITKWKSKTHKKVSLH